MTKTTENTHLFLGFNIKEEQPTLVPFQADKNIEIIGKSGSGKHNLVLSILLQEVNNGKPKKVHIIADKSGDYQSFIDKGALHTENVDEYVEYVYNAYEALSEGYKESILLIENLDRVIKATDAEVIQHLLLALEEQKITVIVLGEEKSLLSGLFNITLTQVKDSKMGTFLVAYDNATEANSFTIKAQYVDVRKEDIRQLDSKDNNQMNLGLDVILNQEIEIDIRDTKNIAVNGTAVYGIPLLAKNLMLQITKQQETLENLFILGKNTSDYDYFTKKGARGSNYNLDNNLNSTIEAAYNHFKDGKSTILVVENLEDLHEHTEKDLLKMVKEFLNSDNARVILINQQKTIIGNLCNLQIEQYYSKKLRGLFLVNRLNPSTLETFDSFLVKPPVVLI